MSDYRAEFVEFAVASNVLCFGEFKTKAGRMSPYFFNAGLFNDGDRLKRLGEFYAKAIVDSGIMASSALGTRICSTPLPAVAWTASVSTWAGRVIERRKVP